MKDRSIINMRNFVNLFLHKKQSICIWHISTTYIKLFGKLKKEQLDI